MPMTAFLRQSNGEETKMAVRRRYFEIEIDPAPLPGVFCYINFHCFYFCTVIL